MLTPIAIFIGSIIVLAVSLMTLGYTFRRPAVAIASGIAWLVLAGVSYPLSTALWDIFYILFLLSIACFIVSLMEGMALKPKEEQIDKGEKLFEEEDEDWAESQRNVQRLERRLNIRGRGKT